MEAYLANKYFFCLHKNENDPSKLGPIGVPTVIRRIIANHVAWTYCYRLAKHLRSHYFAVGIDIRMDFVIKTSQLAINEYNTEMQQGASPLTFLHLS